MATETFIVHAAIWNLGRVNGTTCHHITVLIHKLKTLFSERREDLWEGPSKWICWRFHSCRSRERRMQISVEGGHRRGHERLGRRDVEHKEPLHNFVKLHIHFQKFVLLRWKSRIPLFLGERERERDCPGIYVSGNRDVIEFFRIRFSRLLGAHGNHFAHDNILLWTIAGLKRCPRERPWCYDQENTHCWDLGSCSRKIISLCNMNVYNYNSANVSPKRFIDH